MKTSQRIFHKMTISIVIVCKTLRLAAKKNKDYLLLLPVILIFEVLAPFPLIIFPKNIIDSLMEEADLYGALTNVAILIVSTLLIDGVLTFLRSKRSMSMEKMKQNFLRVLADKTLTAPYVSIENSTYMEKINRAKAALNGESTWTVSLMKGDKGLEAIGSELTNIIAGIIKISGVIYILAELNSLIIVFICAVVIISATASSIKKRADYRRRVRTSRMGDQAQYYRQTMLDPGNGKEIRQDVMQNYLLKRSLELRNRFIDARFKRISTNIIADSIRVIFSVLQEFFIYAYLILQVILHGMTIGGFTIYATTIQALSQFIMQLVDSILNLNLFSEYLVDYFDIIEAEEPPASRPTRTLNDPEMPHVIEFQGVWFAYPESNRYVLKDVSIVIRSGEKLSIVGANGAGKTSFVKLLLRLYQPQKGRIYLDGVDIEQYTMESYLKAFSAIFQDYAIYDLTVRENISFADQSDDSALWAALRKAKFSRQVEGFVGGLDTMMSKRYSADGVEMSQGQQQKIAIARAFYKSAGVVILDEPTAALDAIAEYDLYQDLDSLIQQKTAIYISHRMSSSRLCDNVVVFDKGQIVEHGPHEKLMGNHGLYAQMFSEQAQYYRECVHD